jgi:hypothetical protein
VLAALLTLAAVGCATAVATMFGGTPSGRTPLAAGSATGTSQPATGAVGLVTPQSGHQAKTAAAHPTPGGRSGLTTSEALFGGDAPLIPLEGRLGRKLAIVRIYDTVGQTFNNPSVDQLMAGGATLLVSLDTQPGGPSYASIAAGNEDATISSFLRAMNQSAIQYHLNAIYFCFEHEADNPGTHSGLGTPAQFIQAWDHIHSLATAANLDWNQGGRLHWVLILTHFAYLVQHPIPSEAGVNAFWPGSNEVDIVGVDGYNTSNCREAKAGTNYVASGTAIQTPAQLFGPVLDFASAHGGLPVFISEWASIPYHVPTVQPGFISQMQAYVAANHEIGAALYWNDHGAGNGCDYAINNLPLSLNALTTMAHAGGLQALAQD